MANYDVFTALAEGKVKRSNNVRTEQCGDATVLYSYSTPIAYCIGEGSQRQLFLDVRRYSITTSKHYTGAVSAFNMHLYNTTSLNVVERYAAMINVNHTAFRATVRSYGADCGWAR